MGRSSKFFEAHFFEAEKETVAGSTDGCYAGSCFLASVMQWDVEDFPQKQLQQNVSEDKPFILLNVLFRTDANLSTPPLS